MIKDLDNRQIGFQSLTKNIDITSSTGKLTFHTFGSLAEFERGLIREQVKAGLGRRQKTKVQSGKLLTSAGLKV